MVFRFWALPDGRTGQEKRKQRRKGTSGGFGKELDVSSSTAWPIGMWDLDLNLDGGHQQMPQHSTPLAAFVPVTPWSEALSLREALQLHPVQRMNQSVQQLERLHVVVAIYHPAVDLETYLKWLSKL